MEIKTVDALEKSKVVHQAEFVCPVENCKPKLGRLIENGTQAEKSARNCRSDE